MQLEVSSNIRMSLLADAESRQVSATWVERNVTHNTFLGTGHFATVELVSYKEHRQAMKKMSKTKELAFRHTYSSSLTLFSEVDVHAVLDHPHILKLTDWFHTTEHIYLMTQAADVGDLKKSLLSNGLIEETRCQRLSRRLLEGLNYLHMQELVHRDIKPENILLSKLNYQEMIPLIADFGLCRKVNSSSRCATYCGTGGYMAPEVIRQRTAYRVFGPSAGYASSADLWSLGITLYEALCCEPPFEAGDNNEKNVLEGSYEFDGEAWLTISEQAKCFIASLLHVDPWQRLTTDVALENEWVSSAIADDTAASRNNDAMVQKRITNSCTPTYPARMLVANIEAEARNKISIVWSGNTLPFKRLFQSHGIGGKASRKKTRTPDLL